MESPVEFISDSVRNDENVKIIRNCLRERAEHERKQNRSQEFNRLRRMALGDQLTGSDRGQSSEWSGKLLIQKAKSLRKKTLSVEDYKQLEGALLQGEDNINGFMSIEQILHAIVRDLSSSHPEIQLLALHCCCNIALGGGKHSAALCKHIGPYLITQLESRNNPLLEGSAWTVGNLCNSGSKEVLQALHNLGCFNRLCSLLKSCQTTVLPSIAYALKFYLLGNHSEVASEPECEVVAQILVERLLNENSMSSELLWLLALLSSQSACRAHLVHAVPPILPYLTRILESQEEKEHSEMAKRVLAVVRTLANLASEESGAVADLILKMSTSSGEHSLQNVLNKLLSYPEAYVRKETLWLIGNLYNHPCGRVRQTLGDHMKLLDFSRAAECA